MDRHAYDLNTAESTPDYQDDYAAQAYEAR